MTVTDLVSVRQRLAKWSAPNVAEGSFTATLAAAMLHLLPATPPAGKHVVDDIPPDNPDDTLPTRIWSMVSLALNADDPQVIGVTGTAKDGGRLKNRWITTERARTLAAELLSAVARAEADQQPAAPRDDQGRTPRERGAAGLPAYDLTDEQVADVAVASGWIEDTPEARAAYLASDEETTQ